MLAGAPTAVAPDGIDAKRQQLAQIEADVARIDGNLGAAAEAYNGARYRLSGLEASIRRNTREANSNERNLARARVVLGTRLKSLYAQPDPTTAEVLLTSDSIAAVTERIRILERTGRQDAGVVGRIREYRTTLATARAQLIDDREAARQEVGAAERQRREIAQLLSERQRVLSQVKGELAQLLEAKQARERRQNEVRAQEARSRLDDGAEGDASGQSSGGSTPASTAPVPSGEGNGRAAQIALRYLGVPYVWGGASPAGFDCSGLISYAYAQIGKSVPHYTGAIWSAFPQVPRDQLQPGDAVFFRPDLGHAGIYLGGGQYVHAPHTGDVVKVSSISGRSDYQGAVRP